mmetsp:Transcript_11602/g.24493  ORF Transcript_11602/g.24493 Transcript_11602/m.24493 type:complete len:210 (-) Transcript_11602:258-887(-)
MPDLSGDSSDSRNRHGDQQSFREKDLSTGLVVRAASRSFAIATRCAEDRVNDQAILQEVRRCRCCWPSKATVDRDRTQLRGFLLRHWSTRFDWLLSLAKVALFPFGDSGWCLRCNGCHHLQSTRGASGSTQERHDRECHWCALWHSGCEGDDIRRNGTHDVVVRSLRSILDDRSAGDHLHHMPSRRSDRAHLCAQSLCSPTRCRTLRYG